MKTTYSHKEIDRIFTVNISQAEKRVSGDIFCLFRIQFLYIWFLTTIFEYCVQEKFEDTKGGNQRP
jgi:hypothetical protein